MTIFLFVRTRFLVEILSVFSAWHRNPNLYAREGQGDGLPGFQKKWVTSTTPSTSARTADLNVFEQALASGEHMRTRNAITILTKIEPYFPTMKIVGINLLKKVKDIIKNETKEDLKTLAKGYQAILEKSQHSWVDVNQFHTAAPTNPSGRPKSGSPSIATPPRPGGPSGGPGGNSGGAGSGSGNGNGSLTSNTTSAYAVSSSSTSPNLPTTRQRSPTNRPSLLPASGNNDNRDDGRDSKPTHNDMQATPMDTTNRPTTPKE
ncbi:hypothetical protein BC938DRAFT_474321 [Jimgerdemannia flammicorona]|uniref:THO complex subunitTHOC2 C-terminal domain-containing protein n=1 Tax=Jimgerdemannia flammicorona TaxID=994334 RepID=A0A433Q2S1_9FUNG|nr:hypothetical protein BC938DRAFT_474321 [Jimgerdemannia flammicorona]